MDSLGLLMFKLHIIGPILLFSAIFSPTALKNSDAYTKNCPLTPDHFLLKIVQGTFIILNMSTSNKLFFSSLGFEILKKRAALFTAWHFFSASFEYKSHLLQSHFDFKLEANGTFLTP